MLLLHRTSAYQLLLVSPCMPGVLSGNVVQIPIDIPVNACSNTVSVIGLLNPAFGNACVNAGM
ncbi:chaplin [Streptomyces sp. NPDC005989]|uniref:chaplin n=1 Tax=Streptomyces sp. NPDC005989 TaxID=3156727 RepID=UPI0033CAA8A5